MSGLGLAVALAPVFGAAALAGRENLWRRRIRRELAPEVALGVLSETDFRALLTLGRFRARWRGLAAERRAIRRLAGRLARAKAAQGKSVGEHGRLLQVQVLTLRTRLRSLRHSESGEVIPRDDPPRGRPGRRAPASEKR